MYASTLSPVVILGNKFISPLSSDRMSQRLNENNIDSFRDETIVYVSELAGFCAICSRI